jgi:hypothetical protein
MRLGRSQIQRGAPGLHGQKAVISYRIMVQQAANHEWVEQTPRRDVPRSGALVSPPRSDQRLLFVVLKSCRSCGNAAAVSSEGQCTLANGSIRYRVVVHKQHFGDTLVARGGADGKMTLGVDDAVPARYGLEALMSLH